MGGFGRYWHRPGPRREANVLGRHTWFPTKDQTKWGYVTGGGSGGDAVAERDLSE